MYGRETLDEIRVLEKLRVKIKRRLADLEFLKKCRDENVLPKFAQIQHRTKNRWNNMAFSRLGLSIVRGKIKKNRCILERTSKNALKLHLKLAQITTPGLWRIVDALATMKAETTYAEENNRHVSKLKRLLSNRNNPDTNAKNVVNLSAHVLNEMEMVVLGRGLNFTVSPNFIPTDDIICCIEDNIQNQSDEDKELIKQDCAVILRKAKPPK
jgi:hypothetical protein